MLTPRQNGFSGEEDEKRSRSRGSIKGMWKKAFRGLKKESQEAKSKKNSIKKEKEEEEMEANDDGKDLDPVYSLLKNAANRSKKDAPSQPGPAGAGAAAPQVASGSDVMVSHQHAPLQRTPSAPGNPAHHQTGSAGNSSGSRTLMTSLSVDTPSSGGASPRSGNSRSHSPSAHGNNNRESLHHIVDESMGSEFKKFYDLTCPLNKEKSKKPKKYPGSKSSSGSKLTRQSSHTRSDHSSYD